MNLCERFLGYVAAKELNAEALAGYIISFLTQVGLSLQSCVCQYYDGASIMSGECAGVQAKIREINCTASNLRSLLCTSP